MRSLFNTKRIWSILNNLYSNLRTWDWKAITISFITACTFWAFNALNSDHVTNIKIPIVIDYDDLNIVPIVEPPKSITVNVSGYGWGLLRKSLGIGIEPLRFFIEDPFHTKSLRTNEYLPIISERMKEDKVNYILEEFVSFYFDTLSFKKIYLEVDSADISLEDYHKIVSEVDIQPTYVQVTGASSIVKEYPDTIRISVPERFIDESYNAQIDLPFQSSEFVDFGYDRVNVKFEVARFVEKTLPVSIVWSGDLPEGQKQKIQKSREVKMVYWADSRKLIEKIDSFVVSTSYSDIDWADSTVLLQLPDSLPWFINEPRIEPQRVKLLLGDK